MNSDELNYKVIEPRKHKRYFITRVFYKFNELFLIIESALHPVIVRLKPVVPSSPSISPTSDQVNQSLKIKIQMAISLGKSR